MKSARLFAKCDTIAQRIATISRSPRVAVIADDEFSGGRGDVVIRRGFQGDVREVADAEGVNKLLFI